MGACHSEPLPPVVRTYRKLVVVKDRRGRPVGNFNWTGGDVFIPKTGVVHVHNVETGEIVEHIIPRAYSLNIKSILDTVH